jgi:hypothetical protein
MGKYRVINKKRVFAGIFSCVFLLSYNISLAASCRFSFFKSAVNINDIFECAERRYGYDENFLRRSKQKEYVPELDVFFDKTDPKEGEKVTATAVPRNFKTPNEEMYYTWYVIHTDTEGNPTNSLEEGKKEAMGRVARGSFNPILFGVDYGAYAEGEDIDEDGFVAPIGGINGVGAKDLRNGGSVAENNLPDDLDNDEIDNDDDNCPTTFNEDQIDSDDDGVGDVCDPNMEEDDDKDDDGVPNNDDNCPYDENADQFDADGDGIGEACDSNNVNRGCSIGDYEQPNDKGVISTECITRCYRHNFGVKADMQEVEASGDPDSGLDQVVRCEHDFATCESGVVGDGKLTTEEEECWQLDPNNADTDGDGVPDEQDLAGLNQQQFTWNYREGDRVGVLVEGTSMVPTNENNLNSYYKIMWAAPSVCSNEDMNYLNRDGCDTGRDDGFNYLKALPVDEFNEGNIDASVSFVPLNPQVDPIDSNSSDEITLNASIKNDSADSRYIYYDWDIYRCSTSDTENCVTTEVFNVNDPEANLDKNLWLTKNCLVGKDQSMDECGIIIESSIKGMGVNSITIKPKIDVMRYSKEYFKVILRTSREKVDDAFKRYSVTDAVVPVTQNDVELKLFSVNQQEDGSFELQEICNQGLYRRICPVYPYQMIAAQAGARYTDIKTYNWQLNDKPMPDVMQCPFDGCELGNMAYFPVTGEKLSMNSISVTAQRQNGENLLAQRMLSVNNPLAVVSSDDAETAWPSSSIDGTIANNSFETYPNNIVKFRADIVPDYLLDHPDTIVQWLLNGQEVTSEFVSKNSALEIVTDNSQLSFKAMGNAGMSYRVGVKITRDFTDSELATLRKTWGIMDGNSLVNEKIVSLKLIFPEEFYDEEEENETASLRLFLASTAKNAPETLLFTMRLFISITLIGGIFYGISFITKYDEK